MIKAAQNGHEDVLQVLLHHPAIEVNKTDFKGNSALFWGAKNGHEKIVQILLQYFQCKSSRELQSKFSQKHYFRIFKFFTDNT